VLALLLGATALSTIAIRAGIPYPTLLALGGAVAAFIPGAPRIDLPPDLILALFVAPILLDAAHDASLRDLRDNWSHVAWLALVAVGLTTIAVAAAARQLFPDFPWAAAIALGALVSPPDAIAALAVLRQVNPPYRLRKVLEGESLLNDAGALLIYKLAVGAVAAGAFIAADALPTFALVFLGSVVAGWLLAWVPALLIRRVEDASTSVILQFVMTFGVWLLAERLGLSGVVTIVVFGLTVGRMTSRPMSPRLRVSSFAIWGAATAVLNILAFTLIGLQMRPILETLDQGTRVHAVGAALAILAVVIAVRFIWALAYDAAARCMNLLFRSDRSSISAPSVKGAIVIGWSGMRGIVTLAAALALPAGFPYRDFILLTAFVVVLGTLVLQGLTLRPLLNWLRLPMDTTVDAEISMARKAAMNAAIAALENDTTPAAQRLKLEYAEALAHARRGQDPHDTTDNTLRRQVLAEARRALDKLRRTGIIGDDAYRLVEEELDWLDLSARAAPPPR
jgi:CPA1 family monovalent cation:H+ antiporter